MRGILVRTDEAEEMQRLPLFAGVAPEHVAAMLRGAFLQRFPAGVELAREGEPVDFLHVVVDGQVEIFARYRDRETTVAVIGAGHSFIVAAVVLDRVYLKSARSLVPSRVLLIPAEAVRAAFAEDAAFARALALELAEAYRRLAKELKNQKLRTGLERLAAWLLLRNAETGGAGSFQLPFDKRILASRLGMAPEVLSRSLATLRAYGVTVEGPLVRLDDLPSLERLALLSPTIDDPSA
ncbi:MAG: cyclic nucleotide-binding domain-containing protein [Geminicoccaceae bacterium]